MHNSIYFTDITQKFIAKSFSFTGAFYQTCNVYNLYLGRHNTLRVYQLSQFIEPWVRHINQSNIRVDGTKAVIACLRFGAIAYRIKKCALANIR